jgi:hypothetical protein
MTRLRSLRIWPRLAHGDAAYIAFLDIVDAHVERHGLAIPEDPAARRVQPDPPCLIKPLRRLDLCAARIGAVIWATGYGVDLDWIDIPVLDARGEPVHNPRHNRRARAVFSWTAVVVQNELVFPGWGWG